MLLLNGTTDVQKKLSMLHNIFKRLNMYPILMLHFGHHKGTFQRPQTINRA